jgi:aspartyl aminopeptidase
MVAALRKRLEAVVGTTYLPEGDSWKMEPGQRYYAICNNSSLITWKVGDKLDSYHFQLTTSYVDPPTYKLKSVPELQGPDSYDTEA